MNKSDYKRPFIVGVFIFTGILILVAGVFLIGNQEKIFGKKFTLNIMFDDIGGLKTGNNVWLSGVKVGTVKKISFIKEARVEVSVSVMKDAASLIWKNSKAKVSSDGFIGSKIVIIYGGTAESGLVTNGDLLQSEKGISTEEMMLTLQSNNKNLLQITDDFKKIAGKIANGEGTIGGLVNDNTIINDLRHSIRNLKTVSEKSEKAIKDIQRFTIQLNNKDGLISDLINDTTVFRKIMKTVTQIEETATAASSLADNLKTASNKLNDPDKPAGMLLQNEETANDLKEIIKNLKTSSKKLDEDLEAIQHNFLFRGYFRKKAKSKTTE